MRVFDEGIGAAGIGCTFEAEIAQLRSFNAIARPHFGVCREVAWVADIGRFRVRLSPRLIPQ
jgi:hypothetical protein